MKELKNKEVIIGLVILIILSLLALVLIIRREVRSDEGTNIASVEEMAIEDEPTEEKTDIMEEPEKPKVYDKVIADVAVKDPVEKSTESEKTEPQLALQSSVKEDTVEVYHTNPELKAYTGEDAWQMEEIYNYWNEYKLNAVSDLIRLPRVRTLTNELSGTNNFYYYGETDRNGQPSGKGLAVYAGNAYYFGDWQSGKRSGEGMYWKIFPDKTGTMNGVEGIKEHVYNGNWLNDYPNGEGQEHYEYDIEFMDSDMVISNVIGSFSEGYYDGTVYIMTTDRTGAVIEWNAAAKKGVFSPVKDVSVSASNEKAVWENNKLDGGSMDYYWLNDTENKGYGVFGLKKAP